MRPNHVEASMPTSRLSFRAKTKESVRSMAFFNHLLRVLNPGTRSVHARLVQVAAQRRDIGSPH
jgi:hypothetical protein